MFILLIELFTYSDLMPIHILIKSKEKINKSMHRTMVVARRCECEMSLTCEKLLIV